jgi:hypothetical protein
MLGVDSSGQPDAPSVGDTKLKGDKSSADSSETDK